MRLIRRLDTTISLQIGPNKSQCKSPPSPTFHNTLTAKCCETSLSGAAIANFTRLSLPGRRAPRSSAAELTLFDRSDRFLCNRNNAVQMRASNANTRKARTGLFFFAQQHTPKLFHARHLTQNDAARIDKA